MYPNQQPGQPPITPSPGGAVPPPQTPPPSWGPAPQNQPGWSAAPQPMPGMTSQQPQTYAVNYLDEIAPPPPGPKLFSGNFIWIILGLLIVAMFAIGLLSLSSGGSNTRTLQTTHFRLQHLGKIARDNSRFIKDNDLQASNRLWQSFLASSQTNLKAPVAKSGLDQSSKFDKKIQAREDASAKELVAKLNDARLNAVLDDIYAREMAYQAALLTDLYTKMSRDSSKSVSDNAKKSLPNLKTIQKSFLNFGVEDSSATNTEETE